MRALILLFFSLYSAICTALVQQEMLPDGSRVGILVSTPNSTITALNENQLFPPASTLKIITALAATLELGKDFTFITQIEKWEKNIIIRFSGDPTLSSKNLDYLISELVANGIDKIEGNIWLDDSAFSGYERAVGWPWDILGVCYSAPSSAITLDENCVQASLYTNKDGTTRVFVPEHQPIEVNTEAISVSKEQQRVQQCDLELITFDKNRYLLSGCLVHRDNPLPLKFAIQDTGNYTESTLLSLLARYGIALEGKVLRGKTPRSEVIATHASESLEHLVVEMLVDSNNLIADNLVKAIGHHFYLQSGSFTNGTEAIKQVVYARTGVDLSNLPLEDGSGLSRNNRMKPRDLSNILHYIWLNDNELGLLDKLPKSGENGTLQYRKSMRQTPIKGMLQAKSGSLFGSHNMAGYALDEHGKPKAVFVQFVSDYYPKEESESSSLPAIFEFEKRFYSDLLKLSPYRP